MSFLCRIAKHKAEEATARKQQNESALKLVATGTKLRFLEVLVVNQRDIRVVLEMKSMSPSKGRFRGLLKARQAVDLFTYNNASCFSVLTDQRLFGGDSSHIKGTRERSTTPILRKDFVVSRRQTLESFVLGADAVLVVTSTLNSRKAWAINSCAKHLGLTVVFEVNGCNELRAIFGFGPLVIGVNNRSINTFAVEFRNTLRLLERASTKSTVLVESGIRTLEDTLQFTRCGTNCFLVGEALMTRA